MSAQALLFALAGNVCFLGLMASLYRPVWFRANGRVPPRWKIGGIWLALCSLCVLLSLGAGFRSSGEAEPVPDTEVINVESFSDIAMPADGNMGYDGAMDAAQAADAPMDAVQEAADPEPVAAPPMPSKSRPAAKHVTRAPMQR